MRRTDFIALINENNRKIAELTATKGRDYAGDEDALGNFKDEAEALGLTPEKIWHVYHAKHYSAVTAYCREGKVESEPIEGRILDMILYGHLLLGLVRDNEADGEAEDDSPTVDVGALFRRHIEPSRTIEVQMQGLYKPVLVEVVEGTSTREVVERATGKGGRHDWEMRTAGGFLIDINGDPHSISDWGNSYSLNLPAGVGG